MYDITPMRFTSLHTLTIGRLFLLLFLVANSGFTVVLYNCSMAHRATTSEDSGTCCGGMDCCPCAFCEDAPAPQNPAGPQVPVGQVVTLDQQCMTVTVAGGSLTDPTIVEKGFTGQQIIKAALLPVSVCAPAVDSRSNQPAHDLAASSTNVATSSVETYVLNASFLI
jgi:hypothetical protein